MTEESKKPDKNTVEQDGQDALAALKRARLRAERLAAATGTDIIEAVDGKPVRVRPSRVSEMP